MLVSAIIPAYNEENTITDIISTLKNVEYIDEIIVISDGSKDKTAMLSKKCGAIVRELPENMGKGAAVKEGLELCSGEIVLFLDADLIGLKTMHVKSLLEPVINNECDSTIGLFSSGRFSTDIAQKISPYLSGQRAIRKSVLDNMANIEMMGYGIEVAFTVYLAKENIRTKEIILNDMTHVMKEEKLGFVRGFFERMKMYWQICRGFVLSQR